MHEARIEGQTGLKGFFPKCVGAVQRREWLTYAVYVALTLVAIVVLVAAAVCYSDKVIGKGTVVLAALPMALVAVLFALLLVAWKDKPERFFIVVSVPALVGFGLLFLPGGLPDEIWHIYRTLTIENPGNSMVVPAALEPSLLPSTYGDLSEIFEPNVTWQDTMPIGRDMSTYWMHLYLVPGLVAKACAALGVNVFLTVYIARLVNAALFVVGGYWVIKTLPFAKVTVAVYLLNPMLIQQEASCSADAVTNIVSLLFLAFLMKARFKEGRLGKGLVIALVVLFVLMAASKYLYALLGYLFLLLVPRIQSKRRRIAIYAGTALVTLAAFVVAVFIVPSWGPFQESLVLVRDPIEYLRVMRNTAVEMGPMWTLQFFGSYLGSWTVTVWEPCVWAYVLLLVFSLVFNFGESLSFKRLEKVLIVALVVCTTAAVILVFREWTLTVDMRSDIIMGVQGRYFLPYFVLLLLCLISPRASQVRRNCLVLYGAVLIGVFAPDMFSILRVFV